MSIKLLFLILLATVSVDAQQFPWATYGKVDSTDSPNTGRRQWNSQDSIYALASAQAAGFAGTNASDKIMAAIDFLPSSGGTVDARGLYGAQTFTEDIFADAGSKTIRLLLGFGTYTTYAAISIPNKCQIIGVGRGDSATAGTVIKAHSTFPENIAVIDLGGQSTAFNSLIQDLTVDASSINGSIGIRSLFTQEMAGVRNVLVNNVDSIGIWYKATASSVQNSFIENVEVHASATCASTFIGIWIQGVAAFRGIHGATINTNNSAQGGIGIRVDGAGGTFNDIHIERMTEGVVLGRTTAVSGIIFNNLTGHASGATKTVTRLAVISGVTFNQNYTFNFLDKMTSDATAYTISDSITQRYLNTQVVQGYMVGDGTGTLKTVWHTDGTNYKTLTGQMTQVLPESSMTQGHQLFKNRNELGMHWRNTGYAYDGRGNNLEYGGYGFAIVDTTYNSIDGKLYLWVTKAGTPTALVTVDSNGIALSTGDRFKIGSQTLPLVQSDIESSVSTSGTTVTLAVAYASSTSFTITPYGRQSDGTIVAVAVTNITSSSFKLTPAANSTDIHWVTTEVTQ